jgi:hypothetical protein
MTNALRTADAIWTTVCGQYLLIQVGHQIRLTGVDTVGKIRYDILFNPGDRFRDCSGLIITFHKNGHSAHFAFENESIHHEEPIPYIGVTINQLAATGKRICRLTSFISLSFRKNRKTFTLMFRTKANRVFGPVPPQRVPKCSWIATNYSMSPVRIRAELNNCKTADRYIIDSYGDRFWVFGLPTDGLLVRRIENGVLKPLCTLRYDEVKYIKR